MDQGTDSSLGGRDHSAGEDGSKPDIVGIIGAGSSGIDALKVLHQHGVDAVCFVDDSRETVDVVIFATGDATLPDPAIMRQRIEANRQRMAKRYVTSDRHTIQVGFYPYRRQIEAEVGATG